MPQDNHPIWAGSWPTSRFAIEAVSELQFGWSQSTHRVWPHSAGSTQATGYWRPGVWNQDSGGYGWSPFWAYPGSGNCPQQKIMCILQHTTITYIYIARYLTCCLPKREKDCRVDSHAEFEIVDIPRRDWMWLAKTTIVYFLFTGVEPKLVIPVIWHMFPSTRLQMIFLWSFTYFVPSTSRALPSVHFPVPSVISLWTVWLAESRWIYSKSRSICLALRYSHTARSFVGRFNTWPSKLDICLPFHTTTHLPRKTSEDDTMSSSTKSLAKLTSLSTQTLSLLLDHQRSNSLNDASQSRIRHPSQITQNLQQLRIGILDLEDQDERPEAVSLLRGQYERMRGMLGGNPDGISVERWDLLAFPGLRKLHNLTRSLDPSVRQLSSFPSSSSDILPRAPSPQMVLPPTPPGKNSGEFHYTPYNDDPDTNPLIEDSELILQQRMMMHGTFCCMEAVSYGRYWIIIQIKVHVWTNFLSQLTDNIIFPYKSTTN